MREEKESPCFRFQLRIDPCANARQKSKRRTAVARDANGHTKRFASSQSNVAPYWSMSPVGSSIVMIMYREGDLVYSGGCHLDELPAEVQAVVVDGKTWKEKT